MTARFIVGDTRAVTADIPDGSIDFILTSPPYYQQRSYLPPDHPDKTLETGSEHDPIAFVNALLDLTAEWRRILTPHGSIMVELADKYAGSGGAGGDYDEDGLRVLQPKFRALKRSDNHPMDKSLCCTGEMYRTALAYGWYPHSRDPHPAGRWQLRNNVTRCSPNPPVGALGKKWRPATSDLVVATPNDDARWWDGDATRVANPRVDERHRTTEKMRAPERGGQRETNDVRAQNPAGAPLLDWWNLLQRRIDRSLQLAARGGYTQDDLFGGTVDKKGKVKETPGGKLLREAWAAGEIDTADWWALIPDGYEGSHYATFPPELCTAPIDAMCPRRVCVTCGRASERVTETTDWPTLDTVPLVNDGGIGTHGDRASQSTTTGWTTCDCPGTDGVRLDGFHDGPGWRPGFVLDPFAGTGTVLAVASGMGRDSLGIDLDSRNAELALERVGPLLLTVEHHREVAA